MIGTCLETAEQPGEQMNCSKCNASNNGDAVFCSKCGVSLATGEATPAPPVTVNLVEKKQPKKIGCIGVVVLVILASVVFNALSGGSKSSEPAASASAAAPAAETGSYCLVLMKYLNEAVTVMGNAGSTATVADVSSVLEKRGTALASGFDLDMAGSAERLATIRDAGNQLLKIRVAILDGGDTTAAIEAFKADYAALKATCE